jgi:hypothetical protein
VTSEEDSFLNDSLLKHNSFHLFPCKTPFRMFSSMHETYSEWMKTLLEANGFFLVISYGNCASLGCTNEVPLTSDQLCVAVGRSDVTHRVKGQPLYKCNTERERERERETISDPIWNELLWFFLSRNLNKILHVMSTGFHGLLSEQYWKI